LVVLQELNIDLPYDPELLLIRVYYLCVCARAHESKRTDNIGPHKSLCASVHCNIIHHNRWRELNCVSTGERINTMWYIHTMGYYFTIKIGMKGWWYSSVIEHLPSMYQAWESMESGMKYWPLNMGDAWRYKAKLKKLVTKYYKLHILKKRYL
jgi:hypothetical protein